jgi:hypothetical protein
MHGIFNDYNRAGVEAARAKREARQQGICVYYAAGPCASPVPPRCDNCSCGLCLAAGHCGENARHYEQPAKLRHELEAYAT